MLRGRPFTADVASFAAGSRPCLSWRRPSAGDDAQERAGRQAGEQAPRQRSHQRPARRQGAAHAEATRGTCTAACAWCAGRRRSARCAAWAHVASAAARGTRLGLWDDAAASSHDGWTATSRRLPSAGPPACARAPAAGYAASGRAADDDAARPTSTRLHAALRSAPAAGISAAAGLHAHAATPATARRESPATPDGAAARPRPCRAAAAWRC